MSSRPRAERTRRAWRDHCGNGDVRRQSPVVLDRWEPASADDRRFPSSRLGTPGSCTRDSIGARDPSQSSAKRVVVEVAAPNPRSEFVLVTSDGYKASNVVIESPGAAGLECGKSHRPL